MCMYGNLESGLETDACGGLAKTRTLAPFVLLRGSHMPPPAAPPYTTQNYSGNANE